jgi:dynein assembly factor 1, axonemal
MSCPSLTYLDDRPVFANDRETAEAWATGGVEAERAARDHVRKREQDRDRRNFEYMQAIRAEAFRQVLCPRSLHP